ncbi:ABC transporter substrate-binding protein [Streptomyces candidus]|uniref:Peptide/nickel transport system substrate-binding protein n=1 Tax=Streptomyces candidus TaxID=67283 RepID=A0A7X0HHI8_9ACTN|nr:ABC transporter substrate-binding protein [Streptomyces candidus]MBB6436447.1 peptide/nickel transport system substrate-binding protein [Streptomyces candidus]GHH48976.1 peptide-binding protein [Streptomyces candidus]
MNRKTLVLPAVVGLLAPALAACGGASDKGEGSKAIVVGTTDHFVATKEAPAPFDPAHAYDVGAWNVLRQSLQTLMRVPRGGGEPVPEAAQQCGFTDTQNTSYRCTLRSGLKFSDGKPLDATDVKFSIDRVLKIQDKNGPVTLLANIDTVETKGENEVVFHLKNPDATFPYKLATPAASLVDNAVYAPDKVRAGFRVDGSGPYTVEVETKGQTVTRTVFTKNPHYKGDVKFQNDKVEIRSFDDSAAMEKALRGGKIDTVSRTLAPQQVNSMSASDDQSLKLTELPGLEIRYLGFNTADPVMKKKAVRQALASVIDRTKLTSEVYGATAEPLYSVVPTTITGHKNSFFNKYPAADPKKAADLLRGAGVRTPLKLTLHYTTDHYGSVTKKEFEVLQQQLNSSKLFDVTLKGASWSEFSPQQKAGKYAVYGMGWFPDFTDGDNYVAPFLDKDNFLNSPYANPEIRDALIPQSRREAERGSAVPAFERIQDIVADDVPILPLWQGKQYLVSRTDITGTEWAVNFAADLQLWELGRGVA